VVAVSFRTLKVLNRMRPAKITKGKKVKDILTPYLLS
jgi:hypothetical protein